MKLRKHKNNKSFLITFTSRKPGRTKTETHVDETGKSRKVSVVTDDIVSPVSRVWATGSCKQSVLRAFLFGRDAGNLTTIIRECRPLVAQRNGILYTITA